MTANSRASWNYGRLAWLIIIGSFGLFCLLMLGICYGAWRIKAFAQGQPAQPAVLETRVRGVEIQRRGMAQYELPTPPETILFEGDTVQVAPAVPPGVAATITMFDGSTIDLWAGTEITLDRVQTTRFSTRNQDVAVRLRRGLLRLNLAKPSTQQYQDVRYTLFVERPGQSLEQAALAMGGSYRVRLLEAGSPTTGAAERAALGEKVETEYVVDQGRLRLSFGEQDLSLEPGQLARAGDQSAASEAARWQIIRDPSFTQFSEREYNNNTEPLTKTAIVRADTWRVYGEPYGPRAIADGLFRVVGGCAERSQDSQCVRPLTKVAQFYRPPRPEYDHISSFRTGITQTVDLDITPYRELKLSFDARVYEQSLNRTGMIGEECALGVAVHYTDETNNSAASHTYCLYARDDPNTNDALSDKAYISSRKLPFRQWTNQTLDLGEDIKNMRRINYIEIYGNGHDYISEVANVELTAR